MTDTLADALPREIRRVSAKLYRWRDIIKAKPDMAQGVTFSFNIMQFTISEATRANATGNLFEMMAALETLQGYSNDD